MGLINLGHFEGFEYNISYLLPTDATLIVKLPGIFILISKEQQIQRGKKVDS